MAIVQTIDTAYKFEQAFKAYNRQDNFSYEGLRVLFDYLDSMGDNVELDVIGLCCEYSEDTLDDIISDYSIDVDLSAVDEEDQEETKREAVRKYLEYRTSVCGETSDGFVYACF